MATQHDLAEAFQLRSTTGWQTLRAILQSSGERLPKRPRPDDNEDTGMVAKSNPPLATAPGAVAPSPRPPNAVSAATESPGHLAKRIAAVRLNEDRSPPPKRPKDQGQS